MRLRGLFLLLTVALLSFAVSYELLAQECTTEVQTVLESMVDVCTGLGAESACAGSSMSFDDAASEDGTVVGLGDFTTAAGTSSGGDSFSFGLMNVHANVPLALSETGLHFMLLGEASVENLVTDAFVPAQAVTVTTFVGSNLRAFPSTEGRVVASAAVGTELLAYGQSADLQWLIVLNGNDSVWVSKQVVGVSGEGDLNSLPVIDGTERSLMQSFSFSSAPVPADCAGTPPSMLVIQGPNGFPSLIEVNGVEIRLTSTIALLTTADNQMQLIVLDGGASTNNLSVPAGFTMYIQLNNDNQVTGGWTGLRPISPSERAMLMALESVPQDGWFTRLEIPTEEEVAQTLASLNSASVGQTIEGPASGQANCGNFRPTSPLGTMGNRPDQAFYWDGASGATGYRLRIFNDAGAQVFSLDVSSNSTTLVTNTTAAAIGAGSSFSWDVQALVNGEVACTTGRVTVQRDATASGVNSGGGGSGATPTACTWSCKPRVDTGK
jgi:hypothetical protein